MASEAFIKNEEKQTSLPLEYTHQDDSLKIVGFWVFLAAELVLFAVLFSGYLMLYQNTANGPTPQELFEYKGLIFQTLLLLTSSFTCGLATYEMRRGRVGGVVSWLGVTVLLGLGFIYLEVSEFTTYISEGASMSTSAFTSSFFTLVGTHGAHVSLGILWMISIIIQVARRGITPVTSRKVFIVGLYWHFLDVVWVFIFTVVYLIGGL